MILSGRHGVAIMAKITVKTSVLLGLFLLLWESPRILK